MDVFTFSQLDRAGVVQCGCTLCTELLAWWSDSNQQKLKKLSLNQSEVCYC